MRTPIEIWKDIEKVNAFIEEANDKSEILSEQEFDKIITKLIEKNDLLVLEIVNSCGRKNFDNCSNRLILCKECSKGTKYRQRDYMSHRRWNEFNVYGSKLSY